MHRPSFVSFALCSLILTACQATPLSAAPQITGFTVLSGGTTAPLSAGMTLRTGARYVFRANASSLTQSVKLQIDSGSPRVENSYPYVSASVLFAEGNHSVRATPYTRDNARGIAGRTVSASFIVAKPKPSATPT